MMQQNPRSRLKISDFGLSKIWTQENLLKTKVYSVQYSVQVYRCTVQVGTPMFMAPEVNNTVLGSPYSAKVSCH